MKNGEQRAFFERNPFADACAPFDEDALLDNLHIRDKNKPYFEKYRGFKNNAALSPICSIQQVL